MSGLLRRRALGCALVLAAFAAAPMAMWMWWLAVYEESVFTHLASKSGVFDPGSTQRAIALLHTANSLVKPRHEIFAGQRYVSPAETIFRSPILDLTDGKGGCASFSIVLARLLMADGFETRLAQMHCKGQRGCHIFVEAKIGKRWVVLDPMYDLVFTRSDGMLATAREVGSSWEHYSQQVPEGYPTTWFTYRSVSYTNWDKIPLVMPALKNLLRLWLGDQVEQVSLRSHLLRWALVLAYLFLFVFLFLSSLGVAVFVASKSGDKGNVRDR